MKVSFPTRISGTARLTRSKIADRRQSARFVLPPTGVIDLTDDRDNTPPRSTAFQELWRDIIVLGFSDFGS